MQTSSLTSLVSLLILILIAVANSSVTVKKTSDELPHPSAMELELVLPDSNKKLLVPLTRITAFENIPMTLLENGHSRRFSSRQVRHPSHSHYRDLDSGSVISVRSVNGSRFLSGHVMHKGISYSLEPIGESEHRIVKSERSSSEASLKRVISKKLRTLVSRRKRQSNNSSTTYVIELHLLLDHTVWQTMKEMYRNEGKILTELNSYYTHILNGIDTVFRNIKSISISIRCVGITIAKTVSDSKWMPSIHTTDSGLILKSVSRYTKIKRINADHVMAFTRIELAKNVAGLAYIQYVCHKEWKVSLSKDDGLHSWSTAAHELAHNLGAKNHDGIYNKCHPARHVMASETVEYNPANIKESYILSDCAILQIKEHIQHISDEGSNCLLITKLPRVELNNEHRIGAHFALEQVCKFAFPDVKGKLTPQYNYHKEGQCANIGCKDSTHKVYNQAGLRAPVGSVCGDRKSCDWNGQCSPDAFAPYKP